MNPWRQLTRAIRALTRRRQLDTDMDDEMRSHIEMRMQENIDAGMPPEEARYSALRQFGWTESIKEQCRDERENPVTRHLSLLAQDLRYGARQLRKNPLFTAVAVLTLALGIGANTAIFSVVNALLFRPLPFHEPSRLVWITNPILSSGGIPGLTGQANYRDWRMLNQSFEDVGAHIPSFSERLDAVLTGEGEPTRLKSVVVTKNFLEVLGVAPRLGRGFLDEEVQKGGPKAVILTDRFWRRQFHADPGVLGRTITINKLSWTVVGILPASFDFSSVFAPGSSAVDFLRPFPNVPGYDRWGNLMSVVGRLKSGVTLQRAQSEFDALNRQLSIAYPDRGDFGARLTLLPEQISGPFRRPFLVLGFAVGCVLLIACANLANLLLARAAARRKEIAVRIALGASRGRLIRQMLTESILLSAMGALFGLPLAWFAINALARSNAVGIPLLQTARVDSTALGFALLAAVGTGLLFGIAPAVRFANAEAQDDLKEASRGAGHGRRQVWMRETLVVAEVALACVLLVAAGLFMRSFVRLLDVDLGFRPEQTVAWRIQPSRDFTTNSQEIAFYSEMVRQIEALPHVESVSMSDKLPFDLNDVGHLRAKGEFYRPGETPSAFFRMVPPGYFKTLRIPLIAGRDFDSHDPFHPSRAPAGIIGVAIVNEKLARLLWPGKVAVGQSVLVEEDPDPPTECKVIGVVGNVRQSQLESEGGPELYVLDWGGKQLVVRTQGTLASLIPAVRMTLRQFDPNMVVDEFKTLSETIDRAAAPKRLITFLVGLASLLALTLASVGIYGVIAYSVSLRTQEIGIRLALGAPTIAIQRLVIREGMKPAFVGCLIGLTASLALTRVLRALLYGVSPTDPWVFVGSGLVLSGVALLACWLPARRAAKVDPMTALRTE